LIYAIAALLWIILSDQALGRLGFSAGVERDLSSLKGVGFVIVTATILYLVVVRYLHQLHVSEERYSRLFENAAEGITIYRVVHGEGPSRGDRVMVSDMNPAQAERSKAGGRAGEERSRAYAELVASAVSSDRPAHAELHVKSDDADELLTAYRIGRGVWALATVDITDVRRAEQALRKQEESIRRAYIDVIDAVTGGKLILLSEEDLVAELGAPLCAVAPFTTARQVAEARRRVTSTARIHFPDWMDRTDLESPVCEALANAVKHAHGGTYQVFERGDRLQVEVVDEGPGIDFRTLPRATLTAGFSTTASLGMGFTIMLQLCERVLLSTQPGRTRVVLEVAAGNEATLHALVSQAM
jgi:anti-sigma regulatory factor (Ser/Thr protein kinase)